MSREREALLRLYGARVEMVESLGGMNEAVDAARAMARDPDVFLPDQFSNPANPEAHRTGTGPEILRALDGRVDVFVAGVGHGRDDHRRGRGAARRATRTCSSSRSSRRASAVLSGGPPGPAPHPGHRRGLRAGRPQPRGRRRGRSPCPDEEAIEYAHLLRRARGHPRRHLVRRGGVGGARGRRAPGVARQADRRRSCPTRASATSRRRSSRPNGR